MMQGLSVCISMCYMVFIYMIVLCMQSVDWDWGFDSQTCVCGLCVCVTGVCVWVNNLVLYLYRASWCHLLSGLDTSDGYQCYRYLIPAINLVDFEHRVLGWWVGWWGVMPKVTRKMCGGNNSGKLGRTSSQTFLGLQKCIVGMIRANFGFTVRQTFLDFVSIFA